MTALNVAEAVQLDRGTARRLVSEARNALAVADDVLARLYAGRAWLALGHASWEALCAAELPELRHLKLRAGPRRERVAALHALGATVREMATATGASVGSVHHDVAQIAQRSSCSTPAASAGAVSTLPIPAHVRVAELVAAAGARGLTIPQAQRRLGWTYGATSGALSRAERRGLVQRPQHLEPRGGFRPYTVPH